MILNVSGRTDIIGFYSKWFLKRYEEGFVDVRNPFNPKLVSRIFFSDVDAIIFCTKNPIPFLDIQDKIRHPYVVQVTLTAYQKDVEPKVPDKRQIIAAIQKISKKVGPENVMLRYDSIFVNHKYTISYHKKAFHKLCEQLDGSVKQVIISFMDPYKNVLRHQKELLYQDVTYEELQDLVKSFVNSASSHGMTVQTCSEENRFLECGLVNRECVDETLARRLTGKETFKLWKARNSSNCKCVEMVDIGAYNTCGHYCLYCYANYDEKNIQKNVLHHDDYSTLLVGTLKEGDTIKRRKQ